MRGIWAIIREYIITRWCRIRGMSILQRASTTAKAPSPPKLWTILKYHLKYSSKINRNIIHKTQLIMQVETSKLDKTTERAIWTLLPMILHKQSIWARESWTIASSIRMRWRFHRGEIWINLLGRCCISKRQQLTILITREKSI